MSILVTGAAGFIGFHLCKRLLYEDNEVIGIDNLNPYYDVDLKNSRLKELFKVSNKNFHFYRKNIEDQNDMDKIFDKHQFKIVVHLAAQAGVRYSIKNPYSYINSNLVGFGNILENCRRNKIKNLIYASSSSVYGGNKNLPFNEDQSVDHPVSLYAATKKANELMAHTYSHLYGIPTTGLRFFTVYGPWGRPDMALFLFTKSILENTPIKVFNYGKMVRDFTYIDDIVESLIRLITKPATIDKNFSDTKPSSSKSWAPYRIFNIGNSNPIPLMEFIQAIENNLGIEAKKEFLEIQPGDVPITSSDSSSLEEWIDYKPNTSVKEGINRFIDWYRSFYKC
tara:strand:- start:612 stop:1625 length:1014 start_codon:yes stop_codon:yes gene_type:complete